MATTGPVEPGCLLVDPSTGRYYHCKLLFGMDVHSDDRVVALMLASDDSGCRIVSDWDVRDDPGGLIAEVTWWP
jgi:hypothetical protein